MNTNVLCYEQLVMDETCKNELKVSHDSSMINLTQDNEFTIVEMKENDIRKRLPTYNKVFLQAFIFKDDFNSCLQIVKSNEVSEVVVLKNQFNCDISSIVQTEFEMVHIQFGVVAHELSKNYALISSLQRFGFGEFHKCNEVVFLLGDVFNLDLRTSFFFFNHRGMTHECSRPISCSTLMWRYFIT